MRLKIISYRKRVTTVKLHFKFYDVDDIWCFEIQTSKPPLEGGEPVEFAFGIPGRRPQDVEKITIEEEDSDDPSYEMIPRIEEDGEMEPVVIYEGTDYWAERLRRAALKAIPYGKKTKSP